MLPSIIGRRFLRIFFRSGQKEVGQLRVHTRSVGDETVSSRGVLSLSLGGRRRGVFFGGGGGLGEGGTGRGLGRGFGGFGRDTMVVSGGGVGGIGGGGSVSATRSPGGRARRSGSSCDLGVVGEGGGEL